MFKGTLLTEWLERKRYGKNKIRVYTVNGYQMTGCYRSHDEQVLVLGDENGEEKIIFLNAISTLENETDSKSREMF